MPGRLLYRDAQGADAAADLAESAPSFLGRGADCVVRTDDAMVSRKNCKISAAGGKFFVEDLGSSNGTFVNERRIQKQQLNHGDIIRCGTLQVRYVDVAAAVQPEPSPGVQVDPGLMGSQPSQGGVDPALLAQKDAELQQLQTRLAAESKRASDATNELETLRGRMEAGENELKMLRQQSVGAREDLAKLRRDGSADKEELQAVSRASEELRQELKKLREDNITLRAKSDELADEKAASTRQFERLQEDVQRTRQTTEELRNKLAELQKTKDEGWRELNSQLSQIEQLREVITEQERILEERRVGLIALESATKDLRADKEKVLRELVDTRSQRDDYKDRSSRAETKCEGLEEEHRRLARMMSSQSGGVGLSGDDFAKLAAEVRELKVENKKLDNQNVRLQGEAERANSERSKVAEETAHLEVTKRELLEERKSMEAARDRAEEKLLKSESLRARLEEEKAETSRARDGALASAHDVRTLHDRALRRIAELEAQLSSGGAAPADSAASRKSQAALEDALVAKTRLESRTRELEQELATLRADLSKARTAGVSATADDHTPPEGTRLPDGNVAEMREKAQEVYDGINEALSSLRTIILTAKGLFQEIKDSVKDEDARKALGDAIAESMARTEDAKGSLRGLREVLQ